VQGCCRTSAHITATQSDNLSRRTSPCQLLGATSMIADPRSVVEQCALATQGNRGSLSGTTCQRAPLSEVAHSAPGEPHAHIVEGPVATAEDGAPGGLWPALCQWRPQS